MFFTKIFKFLSGYVILRLTGYSLERFINICTRRGIPLLYIKKYDKTNAEVCVYIKDFALLRPIAYKTHTRVRIHKKCGFPILMYKYRKRYAMFIGVILFVIALAVTSQYVWFIEVEGGDGLEPEMIMGAVNKAGIEIGARKSKILSGNEMRDIIITNTNDVSWAWVYIHGTKATVHIKQSVVPPKVVDKNSPCDIVSLKDGVIKSVTAKEGESRVKVGDAILAGDVIIAGTLPSEFKEYRLVHAIGEVQAYTYYKKTGVYKLYKERHVQTGNKKTLFTLKIFSKKINLFKNSSISYAEYDTIVNDRDFCIGKDNYIGLGYESVVYNEIEIIKEPLPYETCIEIAKNDLEEKISKQILPYASLQKSKIIDEKIDDETVKVTLQMDFIEKIGSEEIIQ